MKIQKGSVVTLEFELKNEDGELLDSSAENGNMLYLHGQGQIPEKLEAELSDKNQGDTLKIKLAAIDGYGEYDEGLIQDVKRSDIQGVDELSEGMQFPAKTDQGMMYFTVMKLEGDSVVLDGNHPLAGEELNFDIKVIEVRKATDEELAHGHVHGPGGHEH